MSGSSGAARNAGVGTGSATSITPVTIAAAGTAHTLDLAGAASGEQIVTLDQTSCALQFTGFTVGKFTELVVHIIGSAGKDLTFPQTITWDAGNQRPVISKSGSTTFTIFSEDGTNLQGNHGQRPRRLVANKEGTAVVTTGKTRYPIPVDSRIIGLGGTVGTPFVTTSGIWDVQKNGSANNLYTTQANRPTAAVSSNVITTTLPDVTALAAGDYITFDVDQIGGVGGDWLLYVDILEAF